MLVLTRKPGQSFFVDGHEIQVLDVANRKVRFGVNAPPNVPVNRGEVQERINQQRPIQSSQEDVADLGRR